MNIVSLKLILLIAIFASGWIGGLIPLRGTNAQSPRFLSLGNAFAAGIFLGIGLIHMLGDASDTWTTSLGYSYPMGLLLAGGAFLLLLWFEHVALPGHQHHAISEHAIHGQQTSRLYPYALIVALSIHSLIAGIALGAQSTLANVMLIFLAIAAHKSTAAFALGVSLARNSVPRRRALGLIGLFVSITPAGVIIGLLVTNALDGYAQTVFEATFLSLAAGSFIYIAALDIIRDEFLQPGPRTAKWLLAAAGYGLMGLLALWL